MAPFAFAIDAIIEKIPGLNKIDFSIDNLQEKVGVLAEPIVIGGILGAIVGALAGYDFSAAFQLGIKMSAVMVLMPKITKCIMDGLMPLSERMKEILTKKSQKRKRNLRKSTVVDSTNVKSMKKVLPYL